MTVMLDKYRLASETDDNRALQRARVDTTTGSNIGQEIVARARRGALPGGAYGIDEWSPFGAVPANYPASPIQPLPNTRGNLWSGMVMRGEGEATVFRKAHPNKPFHFMCVPPVTPATTRGGVDTQSGVFKDIELTDFMVEDDVEALGHSAGFHMFSLNAVDGVLLSRIKTRGARGDHYYIGSGILSPEHVQCHNRNVAIASPVMDGVAPLNRNGVSVIDCDGFTLSNGAARYLNRPGEPGVVDLEPNGPTRDAIVRNILIDGLVATDCGGAALAFLLRDNDSLPNPIHNIVTRDVIANRCAHGLLSIAGAGGDMAVPWDIHIIGGGAIDCSPMEISSGKGILIEEVDYTRARVKGFVGRADGRVVYDLTLRGVKGGELDAYGWQRGKIQRSNSTKVNRVGKYAHVAVVVDWLSKPPEPVAQ